MAKRKFRHAPCDKLAIFGRPVSQCEVRLALGKTDDARSSDHFKIDGRIAFMKCSEAVDKKTLSEHPAARPVARGRAFMPLL